MRKCKSVVILIFIFCTLMINISPVFSASESDAQEITKRIQEIYNIRAQSLITGANPQPVQQLYDLKSKYAQWAYQHEQNKISFVQNWAKKRGVKFNSVETKTDVKYLKIHGDKAICTVFQTMALNYIYPKENNKGNRFGIGTIHALALTRKNGTWLVLKEYYTDGLGDDTLVYKPQPDDGMADLGVASKVNLNKISETGKKKIYHRQAAVAYADKYAGKAWGAGNNGRYNHKYSNLNGAGGDCTNFISQCLGDREGGKISMDGSWYCRGSHGSAAWVRTVSFAHWLIYSGRATKLAKGTFNELNRPGDKFKAGAIRELRPGDIIAYEEKGEIQHFAMVTAVDSSGYPLINAHTTDRYHCPWDMGWDRKTVFHLFRLRD